MRALLPLLLASALLLTASAASAQSEHWFDNGVLHFPVGHELFVTVNRIESPEGPVEVVRVQPSNPLDGAVQGQSFVLISIFSDNLPGEGTQEELALASVLDGARVALERFATVSSGAERLRVGTDTLSGRGLEVRYDEARALIRAAAITMEDHVVVFYLHEAAGEEGAQQLSEVLQSIRAGAAPDVEVEDEHRTILPPGLRVPER